MRLCVPIVCVLAFLSVSCVSNVHERRPFTKEWQHDIEHDKSFQERRARIDRKDQSKLKGDGGAIGQNYNDGSPMIGNPTGVGANVDTNGNAVLQYGIRW